MQHPLRTANSPTLAVAEKVSNLEALIEQSRFITDFILFDELATEASWEISFLLKININSVRAQAQGTPGAGKCHDFDALYGHR